MDEHRRVRVLAIDRAGYHRYLDTSGQPILDPSRYAVTFLTTSGTAHQARRHVENAAELSSETELWRAVRANLANEAADHLVCISEHLLLQAAEFRDEFGIPGMSVAQTRPFRDKVLMKELATQLGVATPEFSPATPRRARRLLDTHGRVVVKPRLGAGSVGVTVVDRHEALDRALAAGGGPDELIVEEWVEGDIIHVDSVVVAGRVLAATAGRMLEPTTTFAAGGRYLRSVALPPSPLLDRILAVNERLLAGFGLLTGIAHHEIFLTPRMEVIFCEIAARPGGGGIVPSFAHRTGLDLYELQIRSQVADTMPASIPVSNDLTGLILVYGGPGRLDTPPTVEAQPWITYLDIYTPSGGILDTPGDVSQAVVNAVVRGETVKQVTQRLDIIRESALSTMQVAKSAP